MSPSTAHRRDTAAVSSPSSSTAETVPAASRPSRWQSVRRAVPTVVIVGVIAGLAIWGHASDWTLPKFSALFGNDASGDTDWCKEHNVPESQCIECKSWLVSAQKNYGWCAEHGIAQCPLHHPDVAQLAVAPKITAADIQRADRALALVPRGENSSRCKLHEKRIQFASNEAVEKAGIDIAVVDEQPVVETVAANGEVVYDQTRSARLASRVAGTVWRVEKQVGDQVSSGDVLALIDAADVGKAKSEFLQAIAGLRLKSTNVERLKPLAENGTVPARQLTEADAALEEARIRLLAAQQALVNLGLPVRADDYAGLSAEQIALRIQFLGLPAELAAGLSNATTTSNLFPLRSPLDGVVVECKTVAGESVDPSVTIFGVADIQRMWLILNVRQEDANYVFVGQQVRFRQSERRDEPEIKGAVSWISTAADEQTRTVKVRVELPNADRTLKANTFGTGRLVLREEPHAVVIPTEAVHSDGDCAIVFVRDKDYLRPGAYKFFHIREVRVGVKNDETTEIIVGLLPGEVIASKNSVVLEAQLLKSNLGAGCACCAPAKK
jgi:cobalt-zinc-cadmium efflux system membrane fusion protein